MTKKFDYVYNRTVKAVQWNEKNFEDVVQLLKDVVDHNDLGDPYIYCERLEDPFFGYNSYFIVQFYAWGDDQEVDPGMWIVVYDDGDGEIMSDSDFKKMYKKA